MKEIAPRIAVDEKVRQGKPVVAGTRVSVEVVLGHLAGGDSVEKVAAEFGLDRDDVLACLSYAAKALSKEYIRVAP